MQQSYFRNTGEQGFILVTLPVILLLLVGLIGLAVDAGRLYIAQQELQASADAAARSSLGARVAENNPGMLGNNFNERDYIENRVRTSFFSNLAERNILRNGDSSYGERVLINENEFMSWRDEADGSLTLILEPVVEVSTMLVHLILPDNNGVSRNNVRVRSTSRIEPANIVFIVDLSTSSACPESGTCLCNRIRTAGPDGTPIVIPTCKEEAGQNLSLRFERIREAILNFTRGFDRDRDRIAMVFFNNVAWTVVEFNEIGVGGIPRRGFDPDDFTAVLNTIFDKNDNGRFSLPNPIVPIGNTNISDGLLMAFEHANESGFVANQTPVSYILLTDGAPTAASIIPQNIGEPVLAFGIEWINETWINGTLTSQSRHSGPGHFVLREPYREAYLSNQDFRFNAPLTVNLSASQSGSENSASSLFLDDSFIADCHSASDLNDIADMPGNDGISQVREDAFRPCLGSSWLSELPCPLNVCPQIGGGLTLRNSLFDSRLVGLPSTPGTFREIFYLAAIEAGNMIRENGGTLYTVGWGGLPASGSTDPFQNIFDEDNLKPFFLSNLANDYYNANSIDDQGNVTENHPRFPGETETYQGRKEKSHSIGAFYQAPDAQAVQTALNLIARQIKLRLIQ
jgi:hypothetical protein